MGSLATKIEHSLEGVQCSNLWAEDQESASQESSLRRKESSAQLSSQEDERRKFEKEAGSVMCNCSCQNVNRLVRVVDLFRGMVQSQFLQT